jgi:hypothetical protein
MQLERLAVLIARLDQCLMRLRRANIQRQMARSMQSAAQVMRHVNRTLMRHEELRDVAQKMERELMRYDDIQREYQAITDAVLGDGTSNDNGSHGSGREEEEDEELSSAVIDKVLAEVLGDNKPTTIAASAVAAAAASTENTEHARVEALLASLPAVPPLLTEAETVKRTRHKNPLKAALGIRGDYASLEDAKQEEESGDIELTTITTTESTAETQ